MHKCNLLGKSKIFLKGTFLSFPLFSQKIFINLPFWENQVSWRLTLLHDDKLSENIKLSQIKIIEKFHYLIYFPAKPFWSERIFFLIFYCSFHDFRRTLEKFGKYGILNRVKVLSKNWHLIRSSVFILFIGSCIWAELGNCLFIYFFFSW